MGEALSNLNLKIVNKARVLVYLVAVLLIALTWFLYVKNGNPNMQMANAFGYLAFTFLSLSLLVTPIRVIWPKFELNSSLYMSRRALGVSAFVFAVLHSIVQFSSGFKGNVAGLFTVAFQNIGGLTFGLIALIVLFLLFATSFNYMAAKLGRHWFTLHKLTYVAYALIFLHAYSIGFDFKLGLLNLYASSFVLIAIITIAFEAIRVFISRKNANSNIC